MKVAARAIPVKCRDFLRLALLVSIGSSSLAQARDLAGKWGFGVSNLGGSVSTSSAGNLPPALSVLWHPTEASAFEFNVGIDTDSNNNLLALGTRYFRHVYLEENTLFSVLAGGGLLSQKVEDTSQSGYFVELGGGAKYFFPGAPNLEAGFIGTLGVRSAGSVRFTTQALFDFHYYF